MGEIALFVVTLIPIAIVFSLILENATNVPFWDDYDTVTRWLLKWWDTPDIRERLQLLIAQHNEHRIVLPRLGILLLTFVRGEVDLPLANLLGDLSILLLFVLLIHALPLARSLKVAAALPISFILFQPQYVDTLIWYTGSISNFCVLAFALGAISFATRRGVIALLIAVLLAMLALSVQANGLFIFVTCGVLSFVLRLGWRRIAVWFLLTVLSASTYFYGFRSPPGHCTPKDALAAPLVAAEYGLNFLGGAITLSTPGWSIGVGIVLLAIILLLVRDGVYKHTPVLAFFVLFLLITAASNTGGRSCFGGDYPLLHARYRIYSITLVSTLYCILFYRIPALRGPVGYACTTLAALLFSYLSYKEYTPHLREFSAQLQRGALSGLIEETGNGLKYPAPAEARAMLLELESRNRYRRDSVDLLSFRSQMVELPLVEEKRKLTAGLDSSLRTKDLVIIHGWAIPKDEVSHVQDVYLILSSPQKRSVVTTKSIMRLDANTAYKVDEAAVLGFVANIPRKILAPGPYQVSVYIEGKAFRKRAHSFTLQD